MIDFSDILKGLNLDERLKENTNRMEEKLAKLKISGEAGGGLVSVTLNGRGYLCQVAIDDSLMNPSEKKILYDLLKAAMRIASKKLAAARSQSMLDLLPDVLSSSGTE